MVVGQEQESHSRMKKLIPVLGIMVLYFGYAHGQAQSHPSINLFVEPTQVIWEEERENESKRLDTYTVRSRRVIQSPRQKLYLVLTDFDNYDKWMPHFKSTKNIDDRYLNFVFETDFGDYDLNLWIHYPRKNVNGYYHKIRLASENEFEYLTLKEMEHQFLLHRVINTETGALDPDHTLLEVINHTRIGGILKAIPEGKTHKTLLEVTDALYNNLTRYLKTLPD